MDYKGGILNYEGINLLRNIDMTHCNTTKIKLGIILPQKGVLQLYAAKVENLGEVVVPVRMKSNDA